MPRTLLKNTQDFYAQVAPHLLLPVSWVSGTAMVLLSFQPILRLGRDPCFLILLSQKAFLGHVLSMVWD